MNQSLYTFELMFIHNNVYAHTCLALSVASTYLHYSLSDNKIQVRCHSPDVLIRCWQNWAGYISKGGTTPIDLYGVCAS